MRIKTITFRTSYWRPGTDYKQKIANATQRHLKDGDTLTISEKALSTALGNLVDESSIKPGTLARFLADTWTRKVWGGPLGRAAGLREQTLLNLQQYPAPEGAAHKQVALTHVGFMQSLRHYSEGGIDASNLPYSLVSLPLPDPDKVASQIRSHVKAESGKNVNVLIVDGDTTYTWRNLHLAPRRVSTPGLIHFGGFTTFLLGRALNLRARQTPIASAGATLNPDRALWYASLYHKRCGRGAGRTVWSMAESMDTGLTEVTWEMLEKVPHHPLMIIRALD